MKRGEKIRKLLESAGPIDLVRACGWIRQKRQSKGVTFIEINDGSTIHNIQIVIDEASGDFETANALQLGACLAVDGALCPSQGREQRYEIKAGRIEVLGSSSDEYPLQKKKHSFEFLRSIAHLRPRTNTFGAVFRIRNAAADAIHTFFQSKGFYYVHTPIITASDAEGAGEMFAVTTMPLERIPFIETGDGGRTIDYSQDFFRKKAGLTVSGQLEGELFAMALGDIYTFGPTFRAENSNTPRHLAEFWMIEPEMAFYDLNDNVDLAEEFIKFVTAHVRKRCADDLDFLCKWIDPTLQTRLDQVIDESFERMDYTEAIKRLDASGKRFEYPVHWGMDLQTEHERFLTEELVRKPVFVLNFPAEIKAFYMRRNDDGKTVAAMDLLVPRIGEIIGGSQREERFDVLLETIRGKGLSEEAYWWYLDTRRFGTAPHAGFGLGFARLVLYLTGMTNIRDVIPFPRTPGCVEF